MFATDVMEGNRKRRNLLVRSGTLLLAITPIAWIFLRLDFHRLIDCIHQVAWWTVPALCAVNLLLMTLQGVRWWIILRPLIQGLSFRRVLSYHFIGVFYSIVLPTSAATDVVKTALLSKQADYAVSWGATWLCRIVGFLALVMLSAYGLLTIDRSFLPAGFWFAAAASAFLGVLAIVLSFSKRLTAPFRPLVNKVMPRRFMGVLENIRQGIYRYRRQSSALLSLFFVSLITQAVIILANVITLYGITGRFVVADLFAFIPVVELIANSGPTPNGMGVREALLAVLFTYLQVSNEQVGIYIFLLLVCSVGCKLTGALPVFHGMLKHRRV